MNRNKLKTYAPEARREFIQAVTDRAAFFGLTANAVAPVVVRGDVAVIVGRDHPRAVADKRQKLEARIAKDGFEQTMEAMAYTWFNRLVAIRFMELHGYLDHGYRVLSHPEGKPTPEILEHAEHVDLPGLKKDRVIDLKLDGNKESDLYRLLLTAQCNALHKAMPFLFERIDDETELLLPANLLHSDSLVRKLVDGIDEDDWKEVEIIGWLYQFYISEKKDEVIGKVVASADIPAATQIFTPNWIVKYLVQNTIGRQWLATYPNSTLRSQMDYYIEPAQQTPDVAIQIKAITPASLDPEKLTMLDPACGSCHILVEGYDLFKAIYLERGYRLRDIPALILRKNLFGLEIDDRAAQLGAFALMMKARADDRRIFDSETKPNVVALQESDDADSDMLVNAINSPVVQAERPKHSLFVEIEEAETPLLTRSSRGEVGTVSKHDVELLLGLFKDAKTFGSLIRIPEQLASRLSDIESRVQEVLKHGDLIHASAAVLAPLLRQAGILAQRFSAVVANPPYMGGKYFSEKLKGFVGRNYEPAKADLYACFMQRNVAFADTSGFIGMITIPNWMFLSSFEEVRKSLFGDQAIDTFVHNGRGVFGSDFGSCSFVFRNQSIADYVGKFRRLFDRQGSVSSNEELEERFSTAVNYQVSTRSFSRLPGSVVAYWITEQEREAFASSAAFSSAAEVCQGLATAFDAKYLRLWHEVPMSDIAFGCGSAAVAKGSKRRWFPFLKGGAFRRWYGNEDYVVDWENDGERLKAFRPRSVIRNESAYFRPGISWSLISISSPSFRIFDKGFIIGHKGPGIFSEGTDLHTLLAFLNSCVTTRFLGVLSPAVGFEIGQIEDLPFRDPGPEAASIAIELVDIYRKDWDFNETSWAFNTSPLLLQSSKDTIESAFEGWKNACGLALSRARSLEEMNNKIFIRCFSLEAQLSPEVPDEQITLHAAEREQEIKNMISYAVGCLMGRFSLDKPGLIYAGEASQDFDQSQYKKFPADGDGIVPVLSSDWGVPDDAADRLTEFVAVVWSKPNLEENLKYVADSLGAANGEQPRDTIRRYLSNGFFKHHLSTYKKRPIYWLFSSGKLRAFQCLVYLHRYNDGTLARIRTEQVIPLQGKIAARIDAIEGEKIAASNSSHRRKLQKEQDELKKQLVELAVFEEKLKHFADQKIQLDLNDGVKANYGKFGDLLAEVKAVTGGKDDE
ncbi:BREX-1 system adenine-specific DNA-methyltransferase PglX [Bradyrhizobium sp. SZCCHNR1051]|uniref:BREX-1 system adenine-specific DNA-methyltransferase PglX n=1 Tax=Bradyrhizobium sp. SZCCHNR1051 TaxID=3057355 RepID=UPI002915D478|nr:BREX-1 system adenine-specific DNA-methyltransferase PglX [Bradyrhizobium sp. SZCCHNR1051]